MHTVTAIEQLRQSSAERIDSGAPVQMPVMDAGDMFPQGDIALLRLAALPPRATKTDWPKDGQIAPGNTTGSRHRIVVKRKKDVTFYSVTDGDPLSDLCLVATAPFDLCHPEHADHIGYEPGIYRVIHQQTEQRTRVLD